MKPRRSGAADTGSNWARAHAIDVFTLAAASVVTTHFWCAFFGVQDPRLTFALTAASLTESIRRVVVARRRGSRPHSFCEWRRGDLLIAIVIGVGPWPIVFGSADALLRIPAWLAETAVVGAISIAITRLASTLGAEARPAAPRSLRQLERVPDVHLASMIVLYNGSRA